MKDASLLIVKPELIAARGTDVTLLSGPVGASLEGRGYDLLSRELRDDWRRVIHEIYSHDLNAEQLEAYIAGYDLHRWGDVFSFFVVRHKEGNTIVRLKSDQGSFDGYQKQHEKTLRAEFGLPAKFNGRCGDMVLTYSGLHCPGNESELLRHINLLRLEDVF